MKINGLHLGAGTFNFIIGALILNHSYVVDASISTLLVVFGFVFCLLGVWNFGRAFK